MSRKMSRLKWEGLTENQRYAEYCEVADQWRKDNERLRGALENIIDTNDPVQMVTLARETLEATDDTV
ncbi:MAG: hypothetical protein ACYSUK_00170 [Planctomycetota bacterium]|jgi:hypothetical protein